MHAKGDAADANQRGHDGSDAQDLGTLWHSGSGAGEQRAQGEVNHG